MSNKQFAEEIRDINLAYLMLAQSLIREDRPEALFRLGLSEQSADLIAGLTTAQLLNLASGNMLLCRFRVDDDLVWNLLTNHALGKNKCDSTSRLHASILLAGRYSETLS